MQRFGFLQKLLRVGKPGASVNMFATQQRPVAFFKQSLRQMDALGAKMKSQMSESHEKMTLALMGGILPTVNCSSVAEAPVAPRVPADVTEAVTKAVETYVPPEHWSEAGFILQKPIWLILQYVEQLNLPLWGAIAALAVTIRVITGPVAVRQMFASVRMTLAQPELQIVQAQMKNARGDPTQMKEIQQKLMHLYRKYDINPISTLLFSLASFPFMISSFMAVRNMSYDPQYHDMFLNGGLQPFLDLSADSGYAVAGVVALSNILLIRFSGMSNQDPNNKMTTMIFNVMQGMMIVTIPVFANMSLAVSVYTFCNNVLTILLNAVMRLNVVRKAFNTPTVEEVKMLKLAQQSSKTAAASPVGIPLDAPKTAYRLENVKEAVIETETNTVVNDDSNYNRKKRFNSDFGNKRK